MNLPFRKEKTPLSDNLLVFRPEFHKDKGRQKQWIAFLRKSRLSDVNQGFSEIMERITIFLRPIVISIEDKPEWINHGIPLLDAGKSNIRDGKAKINLENNN